MEIRRPSILKRDGRPSWHAASPHNLNTLRRPVDPIAARRRRAELRETVAEEIVGSFGTVDAIKAYVEKNREVPEDNSQPPEQ